MRPLGLAWTAANWAARAVNARCSPVGRPSYEAFFAAAFLVGALALLLGESVRFAAFFA